MGQAQTYAEKRLIHIKESFLATEFTESTEIKFKKRSELNICYFL